MSSGERAVSTDSGRAGRTVGDALAEFFSALGRSWNEPLADRELGRPWRFMYALAGSLTWAFFGFRADRDSAGVEGLLGLAWGAGVGTFLWVAAAGWFAWLVAYQDRACSPARFFLEGILFPALTAALLSAKLLHRLIGG